MFDNVFTYDIKITGTDYLGNPVSRTISVRANAADIDIEIDETDGTDRYKNTLLGLLSTYQE